MSSWQACVKLKPFPNWGIPFTRGIDMHLIYTIARQYTFVQMVPGLSFLQMVFSFCKELLTFAGVFFLQRIAHFYFVFLLLELLPLTLSALLPIAFSSLMSSLALFRALALSSRNFFKSLKSWLCFKSNAFACFSCFSSTPFSFGAELGGCFFQSFL